MADTVGIENHPDVRSITAVCCMKSRHHSAAILWRENVKLGGGSPEKPLTPQSDIDIHVDHSLLVLNVSMFPHIATFQQDL